MTNMTPTVSFVWFDIKRNKIIILNEILHTGAMQIRELNEYYGFFYIGEL